MKLSEIDSFELIGISIVTSNDTGKAEVDIPALWERFFAEGIIDKIPNKVNDSIYSVYTDYEGDQTQPYRVILGCRVSDILEIPDDMIAHRVNRGTFGKFTAKGNMADSIVYNKWLEIWNLNLERSFESDYELYDHRSRDMSNAEVDIFIGVK